ncbi:peptide chain release factor I [Sphingomonas sp. Leaf24]|uniref:alternative ribosome rescue aminoacyl-tRNA hydrolase ArfB n=1 Tax=unclassified Sphingomonas TaxID=196159 RepID=UPI0006F9FDB8|nr:MULTISPECIES: alternative ribosome rescue aminoacyl-tRNA hydrolase ArfB [unclassified Sphingomonas]KQM13112.1 peptide chain release factor I [Sphingomonas sp. Leaf5]KQM85698.1 peptide chain release factor I [Sphingomonas sp. Leaf24]KQM95200.1 peptide chain release factor I [Sphingomonas sp. Leaf22]
MPRIPITRSISIDSGELVESFTRASGPGGQHVNTTDSAVLLRFDVGASPGLPDAVKNRLAVLAGSRLTKDGVLTLRADGSRSQEMNRREVRERLFDLIREATIVPKKRRATKPTKASQVRRVDAKKGRSQVKAGRGKVRMD